MGVERPLFVVGWGATTLGVVMAVGAVVLGRAPRTTAGPASPRVVASVAAAPKLIAAPAQRPSYELHVLAPTADAVGANVFSEVAHVVFQNERAIAFCFDRAGLRGVPLVAGRFVARLDVGFSGRVRRTDLSGSPAPLRQAIEPCVREVISRWAFPSRHDRYPAALEIIVHAP